MPLFNQAFVFEEPAVDDLARATSWLSARKVPFWVTAPDSVAPAVADMAEAAGLNPAAATMPGMVYSPLADLSVAEHTGAEILAVTESAQLGDVAIVTSEAFGAPLELAGALSPASTLDDDRCAWFLGYVDGEVAACGQLLRTTEVAGVYAIGVRERFRGRGLRVVISASVLTAGRDLGCSIGVLQASPMGDPVYRRMGFKTVTQYNLFVASD